MKKYAKIIFFISSIIIINSCNLISQPEEDTLSVSTTSIGIKKNIISASFDINCSDSWNADISGGWATISPTSGNGNGHVSIKTSSNNTGKKRYATITVSSGTQSVNVDLVQGYTE
jgi:hypothetical protein